VKIVFKVVVISFFLLTKCNDKRLAVENNEALTFDKAEYKRWVAGISGGGAGYSIQLALQEQQVNIVLEKIVFKNWIVDLSSDDSKNYYASINDGTNNTAENTLGGVIGGENKTSEMMKSLPVNLEEDESLIYYEEAGKEKFYKKKLSKSSEIETPRY